MQSINITFPLIDSSKNQLFNTNVTTKSAFSSDLLLLLLTNKGERYLDPEYGTDLLKFIFDPNSNSEMESKISESIKNAVKKYIPSLTVNKVTFTEFVDENQLNVKINFTYDEDAFSEDGEINMTF